MSSKTDGNKNPKSAKVLKLGFNISVSGDPDTDFEIVLTDDREQKAVKSSSSKNEDSQCLDPVEYTTMDMPNHELEKTKTQEVIHSQSTGAIPKHRKSPENSYSPESPQISESEKAESSVPKDSNIIDQIKSTMEHFEKFSDHIKEIPRLRNHPVATSTPLADKYNSKSESNLTYTEYRPRKFSHCYDFYSRKEYFKSSIKPLPQDLFLKPLPAEGYYKRGIYSRYLDLEPYKHFGSDNSLNKTSDYKSICAKPNLSFEKQEDNFSLEPPSGILKKSDSESGDKQSTSSADSIKDIKIYQSGGILIMQNFKDNLELAEKKEMSEFSAKLIENCNKLKMEVSGFQDDINAIGTSSDENKNLGKMVQFDLSSLEGQKSKSGDSSSNAARDESSARMESSESTSDCMKNKDSSPQGTSQSQDFPSLSTQENDSIVSNQPAMSPSYSSSKKLEWDSGADIGYLNLDLTKENLSTIEKIVLKGLSSDGKSEKNVVYEKQPEQNQTNRSKFILERMPSDVVIEAQSEGASNSKNASEGNNRENDLRRVSGDETGENATSKGELHPKFEAKSSSNESSARKISTIKLAETHAKRKLSETTDKSVNVNTLFDDTDFQTPLSQRITRELIRSAESLKKPKLKKSPKVKASKSKNRPVRAPKKGTPPPATPLAMGGSKKIVKTVEAAPDLNEVELSREVEEIIIDQKFKLNQNVQVGEATGETDGEIPCKDKVDGVNEVKTKGRPISASSVASNSTVLRKVEEFEEKTKTGRGKFNDQVIQTSDCDCESVAIQAFSSRKSSDFDFRIFTKNSQKSLEKTKESISTSCKNIQAFGLNSSLPKQLAHPKGTEVIDNQHTKSTQFFGGPVNSLPNYHSNLITKPGESCGRMPNILKTKKTFEAEVIRLKEENQKNILANDVLSEPKTDSKKFSNNENKENLITKMSTNSKRSQSSRRNSKGNGTASQDSDLKVSEEKAKKKSPSVEGSDCPHTSDEVSSIILTSEVLKVHGDSIDRNIIKEKYFQSQLVELEKRKMISRSTSMDMQLQLEEEENGKEYTTTGCQYSPQSRGTTSGGQDQELEDDSSKENPNRETKRSSIEQLGSAQNVTEERFVASKSVHLGAGDSLPSSTQTAHSWVPGVQISREDSDGVGRARSFEYLPGHIYESSGNLREKLPSETEQNLITSSSESDTAKGSASDGGERDSEGRNTLILENSSVSSQNSNQMKILDDNLSRLSSALLKFWEKDAQVQSITQSLFMNFWRQSGSGDWLLSAGANMSKIEGGDSEGTKNSHKKRDDTLSEEIRSSAQDPKQCKGGEFSIACQTEGKSPSDSEKFHEDRNALEKRISEEKKSQIKWIENEIHHLNILRKLLEKQNNSVQRKQKQVDESNEVSKSEDQGNLVAEKHPGPVTPVYGCTIILDDNPRAQNFPPSVESLMHPQYHAGSFCSHQFASRSGLQNDNRNFRLSVGVQVSLNDSASKEALPSNYGDLNSNRGREIPEHCSQNSKYYDPITTADSFQSGVNIEAPSGSINSPSVRTDFSSGQCNTCGKDNCFCVNISDKSNSSLGHHGPNRLSERKGFRCQNCIDNENKTTNSSDPDFRVMERGPVFQPDRIVEQNETQDLSESFVQSKSVQITNCKCQKCPKRLPSGLNKGGIVCRGKHQSNIYIDSEKPAVDYPCSKVQIEKCSNCHIIRIHGLRCCSAERSKRQNPTKQTENEYCQTDPHLMRESKSSTSRPNSGIGQRERITPEAEIISSRRGANRSIRNKISEADFGTSSSRATEGRRRSPNPEAEFISDGKAGQRDVRGKHPETNFDISRGREAEGKRSSPKCSCRRKAEKERAKDDHPRHYFLKIEEAEVDDDESLEQKKSLEVITVTVPVRKAGKGKIYSDKIRQSSDIQKLGVTSSRCHCRAEPVESRKQVPDYEPRMPTNYRRKADSPSRISSRQTQEAENFYEESVPYSSGQPRQQDYQDSRNVFAPREAQKYEDFQEEFSPHPVEPPLIRRESHKCRRSPLPPTHSRETENFYEESRPHSSGQSIRQEYFQERNRGFSPVQRREDEYLYEERVPHPPRKPCRREYVEDRSKGFAQREESENFYEESTPEPSGPPSRQEHYRSALPQSSSLGGHVNECPEPECCESCNCMKRNAEQSNYFQSDYNSHKKNRTAPSKEYYDSGNVKFPENMTADGRTDGRNRVYAERDPSSQLRQRGQGINPEYYDYNRREYMTKSEILKEEQQKRKAHQLSLQEYLSTNRPDFYNSAERRRHLITEKAHNRIQNHKNRMECLMKVIKQCPEVNPPGAGSKRIFTTEQMREQTLKRYKYLPEVTGKMADQKKKDEYRTNRLMAEIFAKKLQIEALKGHTNLSNSVSVLYTI